MAAGNWTTPHALQPQHALCTQFALADAHTDDTASIGIEDRDIEVQTVEDRAGIEDPGIEHRKIENGGLQDREIENRGMEGREKEGPE